MNCTRVFVKNIELGLDGGHTNFRCSRMNHWAKRTKSGNLDRIGYYMDVYY